MARSARLITPKGKRIDLSDDIYKQVRALLSTHSRKRSRAKITATIRATYGKYAGGVSLTEALLVERAKERDRENAKLKLLHG